MPELKLTEKQERFCKEYLVDFNASRAARAAGYSGKSSRVIATENLTKPAIQERLHQLVRELNQADPADTIRKCIAELQMIAFGDLRDFMTWDGQNAVFKPSSELGDEARMITEVSTSNNQYGTNVKMKLADKLKAMEMLGKYYGFLKETVDHKSSDGSMTPQVSLVELPRNGREAESEK